MLAKASLAPILRAAQLALALLLLGGLVAQGLRLLERAFPLRLELGGRDPARLSPGTSSFLAALEDEVELTFFVSERAALPAERKRIEGEVRRVLEAFRRAAPGRVEVRVLDPGLAPERGAAYAAGRSASPIVVPRVLRDAAAQQPIWCSLVVTRGEQRESLIGDIRAADLPALEGLIVESLRAPTSARRPVIALATPPSGYEELGARIEAAAGVQVLRIDFDARPELPPQADALLWVEPRGAGAEHAAELARALASGRSALVAGNPFELEPDAQGAGWRVRARGEHWRALLWPFGLGVAPLLLSDRHQEAIPARWASGRSERSEAPFHLRVLPSQTHTKSLSGPPTGILLLDRASPLAIDAARVAGAGFRAELVSTSSEHTLLLAPTEDGWLRRDATAGAPAAPKQPWLVHLVPEDPWHGSLLVATSSALFHEELLSLAGNANAQLLRTLVRTLADPARLARLRVPRALPERLPLLSLAERLAWRAWCSALLPLVALALVLRRSLGRGRDPLRGARQRRIALGALGLAAAWVASASLGSARGPALELGRGSALRPAPVTQRLVEACRAGLVVELVLSEPALLPPSMKAIEKRALAALRALGLRPRLLRPESASEAERERLRAAGVRPFAVERIEQDRRTSTRVFGALLFTRGDRSELIPELDALDLPNLEFLVASALARLEGARAPRVAFLSDLPRLSPAEAHSDYQQKGYSAPIGADVYAQARKLIERHGYEVLYVNPEEPRIPEGADVLVWLQPRYVQRSIEEISAWIASGRKAFIALQHYNVQQRQYRGARFDTVHWPQPQFHGLNDWLEAIGLRQVGEKRGEEAGEVLYDKNHARLALETQVNRSAFREHDLQEVARPFLIRALGDSLARDSLVTRQLGELLFVWGNRFALDEALLAERGIEWEVLVSTSPYWWSYAWNGGWLPEESFAAEPREARAPQPLALRLRGPMPRMQLVREEDGREVQRALPVPPGAPAAELVLSGCSEMFKDAHLHDPRYQHDQYLLNVLASLAHGEELAALQARRSFPPGFGALEPELKLRLRLVVVALAPLLLLCAGLLRARLRRSPWPGRAA